MRVLILANGDPPPPEVAARLVAEHDLLLVTDGAVHRAAGLGLIPDLICGDYDSIDVDVARSEFPHADFVPTPDQDFADLEKALRVAQERGATAITVTGAGGGRIDFTLANHALLLRYHRETYLRFVSEGSEVWAVSGSEDLPGELHFATIPGDTVSVLSLDGRARVSIVGVRWPLNAFPLPIGTHGISNIAHGDKVIVRAQGGAVLVFRLFERHTGE